MGENGSERLALTSLEYGLPGHRFGLSRKGQSGGKYELTSEDGEFRFVRTQGRPWDIPLLLSSTGFPIKRMPSIRMPDSCPDWNSAFESLFGLPSYAGPLREFPQRYYAWKGSELADMGLRGERVVDAMLGGNRRWEHITGF